ncbi:MAG: NERD domain-containing protein [Subdoligranulum sp.]|nr:NERD domain-containing protein [Subdoligranulum sp.]MBD5102781.1 NERD domain-containing protein [Subdoligranulum sp.]
MVNDLILLLLVIVIAAAAYFFLAGNRDNGLEKPRKAKNLDDSKKSAEPLRATKRFAALHQYQVIAPAQLAKDGKFADLDFILVGWFGLLCVKCIGLGGQIYGSLEDDMWLQVDADKRISFANPMRAAEADTRLVRDTLFAAKLRNIPVETVCVFTNKKATLLLPRTTGHYTLKEFKALLDKSKYDQDKGVDIPKAVEAVKKWVVTG